jgi:type II secretory ATPase GspE/PulE/Tfp pilus assembly ATPase PilB-like protein
MARVDELANRLETERQLREIANILHSIPLDDLILSPPSELHRFVGCERLTIFAKDPVTEEIYARSLDGSRFSVRLPITAASPAGYVALHRKSIRIDDVSDPEATAAIDPALSFNPMWDEKTGFQSRQILAVPVLHEGRLYGVIQCTNTRDGTPFREDQEAALAELAKSVGIAFFNQRKVRLAAATEDLRAGRGEAAEDAGPRWVSYSPDYVLPQDILEKFTVDYLRRHAFVPLAKAGNRVTIVMADPKNLSLRDDIARRLGLEVIVNAATIEDIAKFISTLQEPKPAGGGAPPPPITPAVSFNKLISEIESKGPLSPQGGAAKEEDAVREDDVGMVRLVNQIVEQACDLGASDIHIEPYLDGNVVVRMRVDGTCIDHLELPRKFGRNIVARLKIMASLDITERRFPQDGKIRFRKYGNRDVELRLATIPTTGGQEDAVLRILAASEPLPLPKLGMDPETLERFRRVIQEPYGIILCVGPTGSGKTTTLHSALGVLNKRDVKIWTAEDPVEITQSGLRQVQVHPRIGFTFEKALRSFLRCDPDVIMIGEMRDLETASAAIEASLTGHLVFSTLHTNNAPETVTRLLDMGLDPFTFGDSLIAVLAQRLVRTLCRECREEYVPDAEEWSRLRAEFGDDAVFDRAGLKPQQVKLARPRGCARCGKTGYRGRMGIHELLVVDPELQQLIYGKALSSKVREAAVRKGMLMLKQDGIRKVLQGLTDLPEVRSVCMK